LENQRDKNININIQGIIPSNFFNFNYDRIYNNKTLNKEDEYYNNIQFSLKINDKLNLNIISYDEITQKFVLNFPEKQIFETLKSLMKIHVASTNTNPNSNFNSRKNSDASEKFSLENLTPGKILKRTINGIKKNFIFIYIDKTTIGRISKKDFKGDFDDIKNLLAKASNSRKSSLGDNSNGNVNNNENENKLEKEIKKNLKMKFKILHIEEKNKIKIVDLVNITNEAKDSNLTKIDLVEDKNKLNGEFAFKGIISKIDFTQKFPIRIDCGNSFENKNKRDKDNNKKKEKDNDNCFFIHFSNLINLNIEKNKEILSVDNLFSLGQEIDFYCKKNSEGLIISSLIPFSRLENNNNTNNKSNNGTKKPEIEIDKKYLMRIMKSFPGSGFAVSIFEGNNNKNNNNENNNEGFVEMIEISDELYSNPLSVYKNGEILIGRVLNFDTKAKKYFASFRNSIINDTLYEVLKSGSTIKYKKYFDEFEKRGDLRNKIFKFGQDITLENNQILLGYIKSSTEKGVFVNLGQKTICRAPLKEISDEKTSNPHLLFKQSQLVICRIISIFKNEEKNLTENIEGDKKPAMINISLRESVVKHNMNLKKKDLNASNFYECYLNNENDENFEVGIIGSTFTGHLEKNTKYMKKEGNVFKYLKECRENKKPVYLELVECDKSLNPLRLKFSNLNIDNNFDKKIVINLQGEETLKQNLINEELLQSVKIINKKEAENEISEELKQLEKETNDVDFEALLNTKENNNENEYDDNENENEDNQNENDEEGEYEEFEEGEGEEMLDEEDYENENLIVKLFNFYLFFKLNFILLYLL
jgi:hypothetical protein